MHVFVLSCLKFTQKHKNIQVFMYFLHLGPPIIPHYIIMVKGLLQHACYCVFMFKIYHESTRLYVFSPFRASNYPSLHHNGKGSVAHAHACTGTWGNETPLSSLHRSVDSSYLFEEAHEDVCSQRPLVSLVQDDHPVALQERVVHRLSQQHPVRHVPAGRKKIIQRFSSQS